MNTQELEAELKRRKTRHNIKVGPMVVALDYDEMLAVQEQIAPFLKPAPVMREIIEDGSITDHGFGINNDGLSQRMACGQYKYEGRNVKVV